MPWSLFDTSFPFELEESGESRLISGYGGSRLREWLSDILSSGEDFTFQAYAAKKLAEKLDEEQKQEIVKEAKKKRELRSGAPIEVIPTPRDYARALFEKKTEDSMALGKGQGFPESPRPPMDRPDYPISEEFSDLDKGIAFGAMDPEKVARIREQAKAKFGPQYAKGIFMQADAGSLGPMQSPEAVLESQKDAARDATLRRITGRIEDIQARRAMSPAAHRPGDLAELEQLRGLRQELEADKYLGWQQALEAEKLRRDYAKIEEQERYHSGLLQSANERSMFEREKYFNDAMMNLRNQPIEMWGRIAEQYTKDGDDAAASMIMLGISQAQATGDDPSQRIIDLFSKSGKLDTLIELGVLAGGEAGTDAFMSKLFS